MTRSDLSAPHPPLVSGFHRLSRQERLEAVRAFCDLTASEQAVLGGAQPVAWEVLEHLVENVVGAFTLPLGVATSFRIDGQDFCIPMVVEETSIIAAASATAKWVAAHGTLTTAMRRNWLIGQIQFPRVKSARQTQGLLEAQKSELLALANQTCASWVKRGGGVQDWEIRRLARPEGDEMLVVHLFFDPVDAMGANGVNQVCESLRPVLERLTQETVGLCILSNLGDQQLATAEVKLQGVGRELSQKIAEASLFAQLDPYRAATHNKGILNGIDPVLLATGNDWRAVEAGAHAYAARTGHYQALSRWTHDAERGELRGQLELPLSVGIVGGVTRVHPVAQVALKMLRVKKASDLARICVGVGLVQNLAALRALVNPGGIVKGHMKLHAANLALASGARPEELAWVQAQLQKRVEQGQAIHAQQAQAILEELRRGGT